jgi:hypothetical protein
MSRPAVETDRGRRRMGADVNGKKLLGLAVGVFAVFFVVNSPSDAADIVKSAQHIIAHGFNSISQFIKDF